MPPKRPPATARRGSKDMVQPRRFMRSVERRRIIYPEYEPVLICAPKKANKRKVANRPIIRRAPKKDNVVKKPDIVAPEEESEALVGNWLDKHHQMDSENGNSSNQSTASYGERNNDSSNEIELANEGSEKKNQSKMTDDAQHPTTEPEQESDSGVGPENNDGNGKCDNSEKKTSHEEAALNPNTDETEVGTEVVETGDAKGNATGISGKSSSYAKGKKGHKKNGGGTDGEKRASGRYKKRTRRWF